ncbi:hypothetical protein TCON_1617 [Astathelohania contejeani]|uniref:Uncharacterized protein n=1 Tax=Astathelohania contejeani TaxID=164912 RepID=A0ABQ7HYC9_9MICR|nr:hypothetical protein TCON_1617 [Thelohania contejeani]
MDIFPRAVDDVSPPFRSFVSELQNQDQFYSFIDNYIEGDDIDDNNNRSMRDITDSHTYNKLLPQSNLPRFDERQKLTIVTLYSLRIRMGSIRGQPSVFQIHFTFRAMVNQNVWVFVEYVLNYDRIYNGYCFYTNNPQLFINMIETHESYEESQALYNMMTEDGIVFIKDEQIPLDSTDWLHSYKKLLMSYANCNLFFFYLLNRAVIWHSTPNYLIFENWWKKIKKTSNFHSTSNGDISLMKEFITLVPGMTKTGAIDILVLIKDCVSKSDIRILADVGLDTFSQADFNIKQIDRVYHVWLDRWYSTITNKEVVHLYEIMVRMQRINQKPVYIEMIITLEMINTFKDIMNRNEGVMFVTEEPNLYIQTFLTGHKQEIYNFIIKDEGLTDNKQVLYNFIMKDQSLWDCPLTPPSPPSLIVDKNLNLKCARIVVDQFIQNHEIYMLDKWAFVCGEMRIMIPQYWRLGVDDIFTRLLFNVFVWPFNPKSIIRTDIDFIFDLAIQDSIIGRQMFVRCPVNWSNFRIMPLAMKIHCDLIHQFIIKTKKKQKKTSKYILNLYRYL